MYIYIERESHNYIYIYYIVIIIYIYSHNYIYMQVGPHKAVAEVSRIGNREHIGKVTCCDAWMAERTH
jgi:hypothetical protein